MYLNCPFTFLYAETASSPFIAVQYGFCSFFIKQSSAGIDPSHGLSTDEGAGVGGWLQEAVSDGIGNGISTGLGGLSSD
uniref:WGS project CBMG000000000 data, contig CS5907-c001382 n=1 Tax=Fusarium acuminatum CS5907 TaxID=1318461 RepID=A0A096PFC6_9HYPO|nr:unnamed protein product [Fusarium acuminatum CS5907]